MHKTTTTTTCGREPLVETIVRFLAHERVADRSAVRACVERAIDESGPGALESLSARLLGAGAEWAYYPTILLHGASITRSRRACCGRRLSSGARNISTR